MLMPESCGCDIVRISRMKPHLAALEKRILSEPDQLRANSMSEKRRLEFLAGRFALKEALVKAWHGTRTMDSFEIRTLENGEPYLCGEQQAVSCSVSHDGEYAIAMVIVN